MQNNKTDLPASLLLADRSVFGLSMQSQENGIGIFLASIAFGYTQGTPWVSQTRLLALFELAHQMRAVLETILEGFMFVGAAEAAAKVKNGVVIF